MGHSTLMVIVKDEPGTLVKVATIIAGRGLNIHELTASAEKDGTKITIDFLADDERLLQVRNQLERLEVVKDVAVLFNTNEKNGGER